MRVARVVGVVGVARVARVVGVVGVARVARVARVVGVVGVGGVVVEASSTTTMDGGRRSARPETGRVWDGAKNGVISPLARMLEIKIEQFGQSDYRLMSNCTKARCLRAQFFKTT